MNNTAINMDAEALNHLIDKMIDEKLEEREAGKTPRMSIIATKGTLDMAYPPFILASTAAALGWEVSIFFTFYGLSLLKKEMDLQVSPLGNPAMPMKMPMGPEWLKSLSINVPNLAMTNIPGFEKAATAMMKKTMNDKGIASIEDLRELSIEAGVELVGCQMTADLYGYERDVFIDDANDWVGAASFLPVAQKSDVTLFI